jgi:hypothetical protein
MNLIHEIVEAVHMFPGPQQIAHFEEFGSEKNAFCAKMHSQ